MLWGTNPPTSAAAKQFSISMGLKCCRGGMLCWDGWQATKSVEEMCNWLSHLWNKTWALLVATELSAQLAYKPD